MHLSNLPETRVLIYSHDNFGLGHLRRCRAIAHALVDRIENMQVLIISGSSFGSNFEYRHRVQFLNIPSIVKLMNDDHKSIIRLMSGEYTPPPERTDLHDCLAKRKEIIQNAAETFKPHLFIVDYSPLGLRGELEDTLLYLKEQGTRLVLGFRDIMDSAPKLTAEFAHLQDLKRAESIYDALWVFGPRDFYDPLAGIDRPILSTMMVYTGFIHRDIPAAQLEVAQHVPNDYLLVTAGGGGDGFRMMNAVISAYISDPSLTRHAILVLGPLMDSAPRQKLHEKAAGHSYLHLVDFTLQLEALTAKATALVTMCGYNTFCETLSFDKRALIIPRITAREEQIIRATRAAEVGLADMIHPDDADDVAKLSAALKNVEKRSLPSESQLDLSVSLGGLDAICDIVEDHLKKAAASRPEADCDRFDSKDMITAQPIVEAIKV